MIHLVENPNKIVFFNYAPARSASPPHLAEWKRYRAPSGMMFELLGIQLSSQAELNKSKYILQMYQGHKPASQYGLCPYIEDQDVIMRHESTANGATAVNSTAYYPLHKFKVKQFTYAFRSTSESSTARCCIILFFNLIPMTKTQKLEYALKWPRLKRSKGMVTKDYVEE